jgi:hypothetical protein
MQSSIETASQRFLIPDSRFLISARPVSVDSSFDTRV